MKFSYADYALTIKALSDETRLKIVDMLSQGELCACDILEEFNFTQPTLSHHMRVLVDAGLVNADRIGAWMHYTLNFERAREVIDMLTEITSEKEPRPIDYKSGRKCCRGRRDVKVVKDAK